MASPKLRFKEFDEDWSDSKLGQLIGISSASRVFKEQWQTSGVPFFRTSDVVSISKNKENEKAYISLELFEELSKKSGKIQKGDLLVTGGGTIGIPYLVKNDEPLYFKDADLLWMKSSGIIDGSFLYNFFISPKFREYLKSISHTGTISHFTIEQAKVTPFQYPSKEEQTKIATFLSAVDEKIAQLSQKLHLLEQYKQGMMQKIFSQQIRFKAHDGSEFGGWEEKKLGSVCQRNYQGINTVADKVEYQQHGYPILQAKHMTSEKLDFEDVRYLSDSDYEKYKDKYIPQLNDILFSNIGTIGKVVLVDESKSFFIAWNIFLMSIKLRVANPSYITAYLRWLTSLNYFDNLQTGNATKFINKTDLLDTKVNLPCLEEQSKIANFLSAIDQKINVVSGQIEQAKLWKKGLLQQMFV